MAYVAGLDKHLGSVSGLARVELIGSELSESVGHWPKDDIGSTAGPVTRTDPLGVLLDVEDGRDGWDLGQRWKLLQGRIWDEVVLDVRHGATATSVLYATDDELRPQMWLDAGRCGLPDDAEEIGRALVLDAAESFLPLGD